MPTPDPTTLTTEELLRYVDTTDPVTGELAKRLGRVEDEKANAECTFCQSRDIDFND